MLYTDLQSLALVAAQIDTTDTVQVERLRKLINVYFDAYNNPPDGVVGVGVITYAQETLISAQLNNKESQNV